MTRSKLRALALGGCGLLLLPTLGCAFAADLVNPDFLRQVGFDPATVVPPAGKVVVTFVNDTTQTATMYAYWSENVDRITGWELTAIIPPGEIMSEAVDCPVAMIGPGQVNEDFSVNSTAASVGDTGGQTEVTYEGTALISGLDFVCGDLIEIRLIQTSGDTGQDDDQAGQDQYGFRVQVHPGR